jgi:hypothetical protein
MWQLLKKFLNTHNVARVRKACRAQMKFELLQKHSRQVKLILHFWFFKIRILIILFIRSTNIKHFSQLRPKRYAILLLFFSSWKSYLLKYFTVRSLSGALANIYNFIYVFSLKLDPGLEQACQKDLQKFCSNRADVEAVECLKENPTSRSVYRLENLYKPHEKSR